MQRRPYASKSEDQVMVRFDTSNGVYEVPGNLGDSLLDVVINHDVPLDGYACCTCHVILEKDHFDRLAKPEEEELDMLDLAPELDDYSRLGCQVILTKEDKPSITVQVPSITRDARALN
ncbi:2Fe-2S iron-sulfur cluster binding domain-containing protein [Aphelenchoides avenae]|nr:2Fe-2S iron-sulfur cluster binding domain-containing protein [Aphelenchus avenae]